MTKATHQTLEGLIIRPAKAVEEFSNVLCKVMDWFEKEPGAQWRRERVTVEGILSEYKLEELFVAEVAGELVGCVALQEFDEVYWPEDTEDESLYLHKLAVVEECRGSGLADHMIEFSKQEVLRRGRKKLRLDCVTSRTGLVKYYKKKGFTLLEERQVYHGTASMFQMELA